MYTILVIDDNEIIRSTLDKVLTAEGYAMSFAFNAEDGFKACFQNKPDLILLDVNLPDGDGIQLCRKIKAEPKIRHIPVLILTGEAVEVDRRMEGLDAGADDYILKPFNFKELVLRVRRIIS